MRKIITCLLLPLTLVVSSAYADLDTGLAAAPKNDFVTALTEWRPLAEKGNARAQCYLGVMYDNGQGVVQDYKEAGKWYRLAADQGNAEAQFNLGRIYDNG